MKKPLVLKRGAGKTRPKKPMAPIEPVNAPLYPPIEDLYPHLNPEVGERLRNEGFQEYLPPRPVRSMLPATFPTQWLGPI